MELIIKEELLSIHMTSRFNRTTHALTETAGMSCPTVGSLAFKKLKGTASLSSVHRRHALTDARGARPGMRAD